jgi:hypothetical protein
LLADEMVGVFIMLEAEKETVRGLCGTVAMVNCAVQRGPRVSFHIVSFRQKPTIPTVWGCTCCSRLACVGDCL